MEELTGSGGSSHAVGSGNDVTRTFLIAWTGRGAIAETLLGTSHPTIPWSYCKGVRLDPFGNEPKSAGGDLDPTAAEIQYEYAKLTAEYATDYGLANHWPSEITKPAIRANTTLILQTQDTSEFMRIPGRAMRWYDNPNGSPGSPVPESDSPAGRLLVSKAEFSLTWDYLDDPPVSRLRGLMGQVNDAEFLGCAEETLLFGGFDLQPSTRASIITPGCWLLHLKLLYREINVGGNSYGWNHEYRPDGWERVQMDDGTGTKVDRYETEDFSGMFA